MMMVAQMEFDMELVNRMAQYATLGKLEQLTANQFGWSNSELEILRYEIGGVSGISVSIEKEGEPPIIMSGEVAVMSDILRSMPDEHKAIGLEFRHNIIAGHLSTHVLMTKWAERNPEVGGVDVDLMGAYNRIRFYEDSGDDKIVVVLTKTGRQMTTVYRSASTSNVEAVADLFMHLGYEDVAESIALEYKRVVEDWAEGCC